MIFQKAIEAFTSIVRSSVGLGPTVKPQQIFVGFADGPAYHEGWFDNVEPETLRLQQPLASGGCCICGLRPWFEVCQALFASSGSAEYRGFSCLQSQSSNIFCRAPRSSPELGEGIIHRAQHYSRPHTPPRMRPTYVPDNP